MIGDGGVWGNWVDRGSRRIHGGPCLARDAYPKGPAVNLKFDLRRRQTLHVPFACRARGRL